MVMVRHNGIGADVDGEDLSKFLQAGDNPLFAMLVVFASERVLAPEKGSTHTAADTVVVRGGIE
jgi:hypothetical protein